MAHIGFNFAEFLSGFAYLFVGVGIMVMLFRFQERFADWLIARRKARLKSEDPDFLGTFLVLYRNFLIALKWVVIAVGFAILVALAADASKNH